MVKSTGSNPVSAIIELFDIDQMFHHQFFGHEIYLN